MERLSKKILSLPVLSVSEGEQLGYVKNLVIDPLKKEIIAFVINQKGWFKEDKIIPFNRVKSIGDNAIVIDKSGTAEKPANLPQIVKLLKNPTQLINLKVVSTSGKALGQVDEFWFDATGKITRLEISGRISEGIWKDRAALSCQDIVTIGKDAIIVAEGAETRLILSGKQFQKTIKEFKSVTSKAWETTVQTSQKLGHAIASSLSKLAEEEEKMTKTENPNTETQEQTPQDQEDTPKDLGEIPLDSEAAETQEAEGENTKEAKE